MTCTEQREREREDVGESLLTHKLVFPDTAMTASDASVSRTSAITASTSFAPPEGGRNVALVLGVTGLVGRELVRALLLRRKGWHVYGVARNRVDDDGLVLSDCSQDGEGYSFVSCDLLDCQETARKLSPLSPEVTHVFWVTWSSQFPLDTPECCAQNAAMMANVLDALLPGARALRHVVLQTGVKHYVSLLRPPPGEWGDQYRCYDEDSPRFPAEEGGQHNFYYALEDMLGERLSAAAAGNPEMRVRWSVHRPGLLLGASRRACFNFVGSLCVYGAVCRRLGLPFVFRGGRRCWEEPYLDMSDARVVAEQQVWASTRSHQEKPGEAFNAVNGDRFAWREAWPALASVFVGPTDGPEEDPKQLEGRDRDGLFSEGSTYASFMADKGGVWEEVAEAEGLRRTRAEELACWPFLDAVFRCPARMLVSRPGKAEALGFDGGRSTCGDVGVVESVLYWVGQMRAERLVP